MTPTFYFDDTCGFCTRSARLHARLTSGLAMEPAQLDDSAIYRSAAGLEYVENASIGRALAGHGRCLPIRLAGRILCAPIFAPTYRFIASHRRCSASGCRV